MDSTASYNSSHMGHTKIISVGQVPPITVFHIRTLHAGEKETFPPLNNAHITKLKHLTLVSLAMERRVSTIIEPRLHPLRARSYRFCLTRRSSTPCKCQRYEIWRI